MSNVVDSCTDLPSTVVLAGQVVIGQGQSPGTVFVLVEGEVAIERDGVSLARISTPGSIFGEMSTLLQCPATATVRANLNTTFLVAHDGDAFLTSRPDIILAVARTLAMRLDNLSGYLTEVKRQFAGETGHLGMIDEVLSALLNDQTPTVKPGSARMPDLDY